MMLPGHYLDTNRYSEL